MTRWQKIQKTMARFLGSDKDVVRRVEQLEQRQCEMGEALHSVQMKIEPLRKLVEELREEPDQNGLGSRH